MKQRDIERVAQVLSEWNPLGSAASTIADLDGYKTEAIDIISALRVTSGSRTDEAVVRDVLNQAFGLSLALSDCAAPAIRIWAVLAAQQ